MKQFLVLIFIFGAAVASPQNPDERVIGAVSTARLGQFPWVAGVYYNRFFTCGGALIGEQFVLTSAECVYDYAANAEFLQVQLGNLVSIYNSATTHEVLFVVPHPDYQHLGGDGNIMHHRNIAVLKLKIPVVGGMLVHPIELPAINQIPIGDHTDVTLAGWGVMWGLLGKDLQSVDLQTLAINTCIDIVGGNPSIEHDYNVCTAGYSSTSGLPSGGCEKDHGSPLVWQYAMTPLLVGVVSQGDCMSTSARIPTIYTSTFGHNRQWINMITGI